MISLPAHNKPFYDDCGAVLLLRRVLPILSDDFSPVLVVSFPDESRVALVHVVF